MLPRNGKAPVLGGTEAPETSDQLAGDHQNDTKILTDLAAELAVAYGLLNFPRYQHQIAERTTEEVITDPKIWAIAGWVKDMVAKELPVDALTLAAYVEDNGLLGPGVPRVQLRTYLADIVVGATYLVPENVLFLLDHLHQLAARRAAVAAATEVIRVAEAASFDELVQVIGDRMEVALAAILRAKAAAA